MAERRSFKRFKIKPLKASYFIEGTQEKVWKECTIREVSYKGIGIAFNTDEESNIGSPTHLRISTSDDSEDFTVKGKLVWVEREQNVFIGGIELNVLLSEGSMSQLAAFFIQNLTE